jgi:hypothetical protein
MPNSQPMSSAAGHAAERWACGRRCAGTAARAGSAATVGLQVIEYRDAACAPHISRPPSSTVVLSAELMPSPMKRAPLPLPWDLRVCW